MSIITLNRINRAAFNMDLACVLYEVGTIFIIVSMEEYQSSIHLDIAYGVSFVSNKTLRLFPTSKLATAHFSCIHRNSVHDN
jgi:hypothetical protein